MIYPLCFEGDPVLRKAFESACDAIEIYGLSRDEWVTDLDKYTKNFVYNKAKELLG